MKKNKAIKQTIIIDTSIDMEKHFNNICLKSCGKVKYKNKTNK